MRNNYKNKLLKIRARLQGLQQTRLTRRFAAHLNTSELIINITWHFVSPNACLHV